MPTTTAIFTHKDFVKDVEKLHEVSIEVNANVLADPVLKNTVEGMIAFADSNYGVGLAAIQLGIPWRVFVVKTSMQGWREFINPEIIQTGSMRETLIEGCLSLPGIRVPVDRPKKLTIKWQDLKGLTWQMTFSGRDARTIQHEYDHLQGLLINDHQHNVAWK